MSVKRLVYSFKNAAAGIASVARSEQNFALELLAAAVVFALAVYFRVSRFEWIALVLTVIAVMILELLNTATEYLLDLLKPRLHHHVSMIKDIFATAVLLVSCGAVIIGVIIFYPHFRVFLK